MGEGPEHTNKSSVDAPPKVTRYTGTIFEPMSIVDMNLKLYHSNHADKYLNACATTVPPNILLKNNSHPRQNVNPNPEKKQTNKKNHTQFEAEPKWVTVTDNRLTRNCAHC